MNNTVYYDAQVTDEVRRQRLFEGQLFVYSPRPASLAFIEFARTLIRGVCSHDPEKAQYHMSVEAYAEILGEAGNHSLFIIPTQKIHLQALLTNLAGPSTTIL